MVDHDRERAETAPGGVVGVRLPRPEGPAKATGEFLFPTDVKLQGMLVGKVLRSPHPHARILSIDTSAAEAIPGVFAVVTAKDVPAHKYGQDVADENIFAVDKVRYIGDEIAAVAAVDEEAADRALAAIRVEFQVLRPIFDPEEAMRLATAPGAPPEVLIHEDKPRNTGLETHITRGKGLAGFDDAELVFESTYSTPRVHQAYMEGNVATAHCQADGKVVIWASTQWPSRSREDIAEALAIDVSRVRVVQTQVGGGFGGKFCPKVALVAAALTLKCKKPVQVRNDLHDDFIAARPFVPCTIQVRTGVKKDGTLVARQIRTVLDNGAVSASGAGVLSVASTRGNNVYRLPNAQIDGYLVYTNQVPTGAYRGYGNQALAFALEQEVDRIADALGMDRAELRLKNATQTGDVTVDGWKISSCGLSECIEWAAQESDFGRRRPTHGSLRYGKGMACAVHVSGNIISYRHWDASGALVKVEQDGRAHIYTSEPDIGQGAHTVLPQIVAEELGLGFADVEIHQNDTDVTPFGVGATGSHITTVGGNAVKLAAADARRVLLEKAALMLAGQEGIAAAADLTVRGGFVYRAGDQSKALLSVKDVALRYFIDNYMPILGRGAYRSPGAVDKATKYGSPSSAYSFGCQVAEVAVDMETGKVQVLNFWAAHDIGRAINPMLVEGQIEGGVVQGIGFALTEEMSLENGRVTNPDFLDYKCPVAADIPPIHTHIVESIEPNGPFGAKGIGELAFVPAAAAIANAIADAVGFHLTDLPITPFRLLQAIRQNGGTKA